MGNIETGSTHSCSQCGTPTHIGCECITKEEQSPYAVGDVVTIRRSSGKEEEDWTIIKGPHLSEGEHFGEEPIVTVTDSKGRYIKNVTVKELRELNS